MNQRDIAKSTFCKEKGITLIEVPYWWDKKYSSLAATVYSQRPDLFTEKPKGDPIPLHKLSNSESTTEKTNDTPILMLATEWNNTSMKPNGWWMTEKYDGMRLYWDGKEFYTRQGRKTKIPQFIKDQMPSVALDGELWYVNSSILF